jgi:hypothetical protein
MKTPAPKFVPQVFNYRDEDNSIRLALIFRRARTLYHAVVATHNAIKLETFDTLRGFQPALTRDYEAYPVRKAASFWLNRDHRPIATRARAVLKGLVARKPKVLDSAARNG